MAVESVRRFTFIIGKGQVIEGWDLGVATMKKGEAGRLSRLRAGCDCSFFASPLKGSFASLDSQVAKFTIASEHAYGAQVSKLR